MALIYLDSSIIFKDNLTRMHDINLKYQGEMAVEKERRVQNEKIYEQEESKQIIIRNGLVVLIVLMMLVTLLLYNRKRLKNKHREQQLLIEKQLAEASETNKKMDERLNKLEKANVLDKK